jgi:hypothetical protein
VVCRKKVIASHAESRATGPERSEKDFCALVHSGQEGPLETDRLPHGIHGLHVFLSGRDTNRIAQEEEREPALTTSLVAKH